MVRISPKIPFHPFLAMALLAALALKALPAEQYGPENLWKTMNTPFGAAQSEKGSKEGEEDMAPIGITPASVAAHQLSLSERLVPASKLYLPGRMILGKPAEFTVNGKPGQWVALAMADKNSGARPIGGHTIHLGADRKVVALGKIPEGGVLTLYVETPIQGDMVGQCFFFEAALWTKRDCSDLQIAWPVSDGESKTQNGVLVAEESKEKTRGVRIVPATGPGPSQRQAAVGIDSGRP